MSRGKNLQEMEVGTTQSKTAVNANAKPAEAMPKLTTGGVPSNVEDLGGPTPENYKPDDDSAKLKTPGGPLKGVKDVVNKGAKKFGVQPLFESQLPDNAHQSYTVLGKMPNLTTQHPLDLQVPSLNNNIDNNDQSDEWINR